MFVQIHMLQSMPPGNLNRDDTGQPKKCIFGGVTRGRISSQCLKRNIRHSAQFKEAFGDALADRTTYLPRMVADALKAKESGIPDSELAEVMRAVASKFKKEKRGGESEDGEDRDVDQAQADRTVPVADATDQTGQLVFFPRPFAVRMADLVVEFRQQHPRGYEGFIGRRMKPKLTNDEEKELDRFISDAALASKSLTVDIGMFGRMTTSDLVVNVEAACQVAHAISTHETVIESDYFTAMDDRKAQYATSQTDKSGAAFLGSGETETFFNAAVYYKYLNLDIDALRKHLSWTGQDGARAASILLRAAALANPSGKQNSFAAHGIPEFILVEVSKARHPLSYANAFLQAVEGRNLMAESTKALCRYIDSVAAAFAPADVRRLLLAVGNAASLELECKHDRAQTLDKLVESFVVCASEKTAGHA